MTIRSNFAQLTVAAVAFCAVDASAQWTQWGGPTRDFQAPGGKVVPWSEAGPKKLWTTKIGDGYSSILVDEGRLYTMARDGDRELVVAISAEDGKRVWDFAYDAPLGGDMGMEFGPGPHATPLIAGDHIYTVGVTNKLHCLEKATGKVVWSHDLKAEFGAEQLGRGCSCSPIAYKDNVIVQVGGKPGQALMAFNQKTGSLVWGDGDFEATHSSPVLFKHDGKDQMLIFSGQGLVGVNPASGEVLWTHPHKTQYGANIMTPVVGSDGVIFCSAAYRSGAQGVQLGTDAGKTTTKELWKDGKILVHHADAVRVGDYVYCSSGDFGPASAMCIHAKTGEVKWKETRTLSKANVVAAGDKLVWLDQDGNLIITEASPKEFKILARAELLQKVAWTVPTLVGSRLYVRDRANLIALDLGS